MLWHLFKIYMMSVLVLTFSHAFIYFLINEILRQSDNILIEVTRLLEKL
jgi:hypothetical protein